MTGAAFGLVLAAATATGGISGAPAKPAGAAAAPAETAAAKPFPRKDVPALVKQVYEQKDIPFCTNPRYPLTPEEVRWCALLPKQDARCPALAQACSRGATADLAGRHRRQSSATLSLPTLPVPPVVLWILLGLVLALIVRMIVRQALAQRGASEPGEAIEVATGAAEDAGAAIARQIETDVQRLLARARAEAAAGDFAGAVADAYAALLRKLEGAGIVTVESHRTNGDHVRDVGRQHPALRPRMQAVVSNVEEVQFGGGAPTEARFQSVMMDVVGLLGERLAAWPPLIVKLAVGAALAGALGSCKIDRERWEQSTSGTVLVTAMLQRYGFTPRERLAPLSRIDQSVSSLVLLPGASVDEASWAAIASWVGDGGTVVIAGGDHKLPSWIGATLAADRASAFAPAPLTVPADQKDRLPRKLRASVPDGHQIKVAAATASSADSEYGDEGDEPATPLLMRGRTIYAVERVYDGGGRTIVLADDELFANVSLLVDDNALLLVELLRPGGQKLELAGELTGLVAQDPITSVKHGRLAPAMLQLSLLILLFFVYKGAHFGRPIDPVAANRRAFSEHARAIGMQYGRRRAGRHALELYGSYVLERLRERLNLTGGKGMIAVAEEVATRTGRPLGEVMRLLVESRPPNQRPVDLERDAAIQEQNSARDLATLREIASLLATTGGAGDRIRAQR